MSKPLESALQSPELIVVEASAGSGKTYELAKRYLTLLLHPAYKTSSVPFKQILAITFTNKATIEMKGRIVEFLKKIALDKFSDAEEEAALLRTLNLSKEFAQKKAREALDALIAQYSFFQVQTIDSFINALLVGSSFDIDRSARFKIKRDYADYLAYSFDRVIDEACLNREVYGFFEEFLEHYLFVENKTSWFPKNDILKLLESLFIFTNKYGCEFMRFKGKSTDIIKRKKKLFASIKKFLEECPDGFNKTARKSIERFVAGSSVTFDLKSIPDRFAQAKVAMNAKKEAPKDCVRLWSTIRSQIKELVYLDATLFYNPYVFLFYRVFDFFLSSTRQDDVLFLDELNRKARLLFDDCGISVADIYYRFSTRFSHYLIDEFQDTSFLQWRNLELMVEESLSSGGSFFYVGDKKQAIYRFRGGEARLFDEVQDEYRHFNVHKKILGKNFRSQKEIVAFNNEIFSSKNLLRTLESMDIKKNFSDHQEAFSYILSVFKDTRQDHKKSSNAGYVSVESIAEGTKEDSYELIRERVLSLLDELKMRFSLGDIAILCRDNEEVKRISGWLLDEKIPVESEKTLNISKNYLILEVVNFLYFLQSPINDLRFAFFILGDIFQRVSNISKHAITSFLFEHGQSKGGSRDGYLYRQFRSAFPDVFRAHIEPFFRMVGFVSVYELVVSIYQSYNLMELFPSHEAFFYKFLELIVAGEDEYVGIDEFLQYFENAPHEQLYLSATETNAVKALTIHKSKGLEFGVVIIPFLRIDLVPEQGGRGSNFYLTDTRAKSAGLLRITKEHRKYSQELKRIYSHALANACIDELNGVYVAFTRARFELYIYVPKRSGHFSNKAQCLFTQTPLRRGTKQIYSRALPATETKKLSLKAPAYQNWIKKLKEEHIDQDAMKNFDALMQGTVMHFALSRILSTYKQDIPSLVNEALRQARLRYPQLKEHGVIKKRMNNLLKAKNMQELFNVAQEHVYNEKEIVDFSGRTRRIDRLVVTERCVLVVDYKSTRAAGDEHRVQVAEYMKSIAVLYPQRTVRGFLLYLDSCTLEEVVCE